MADNPLRVIIRVCVLDIPGQPLARPFRLGRDFCEQILSRPFNDNEYNEHYDAVHCLPNFDSENDVKAWFLYDLNITSPLSKEEVMAISHKVYFATRQGDSWIFTPRDQWIDEARRYCSMYKWGGSYTGRWEKEVREASDKMQSINNKEDKT